MAIFQLTQTPLELYSLWNGKLKTFPTCSLSVARVSILAQKPKHICSTATSKTSMVSAKSVTGKLTQHRQQNGYDGIKKNVRKIYSTKQNCCWHLIRQGKVLGFHIFGFGYCFQGVNFLTSKQRQCTRTSTHFTIWHF